VWPLSEPGGLLFEGARIADRILFELFGSRRSPPPTVTLTDCSVETNPITRGARWLGRL
jgi:hypothetical protein